MQKGGPGYKTRFKEIMSMRNKKLKTFKILSLVLSLILLLFAGQAIFSQESTSPYPPWAILNATYMGDIELMSLILESNPDRDVRDAFGGTALHIAIFQNNPTVIRYLVENGFDINARASTNGFTPLHYCVWVNNPNAARILLAYNADRDVKCNEGLTPLEMATKNANREMILALMRR